MISRVDRCFYISILDEDRDEFSAIWGHCGATNAAGIFRLKTIETVESILAKLFVRMLKFWKILCDSYVMAFSSGPIEIFLLALRIICIIFLVLLCRFGLYAPNIKCQRSLFNAYLLFSSDRHPKAFQKLLIVCISSKVEALNVFSHFHWKLGTCLENIYWNVPCSPVPCTYLVNVPCKIVHILKHI